MTPPAPGPSPSPYAGADPLYPPAPPPRLRPLWPAFAVLGIAGVLLLLSRQGLQSDAINPAYVLVLISILLSFAAYIYYFLCVHRMIRTLEQEPGWNVDYTPAGAVWRQFIPFYNLVFNYRWTGDVADYAKWRLGNDGGFGGRTGLWAFLLILLGALASNALFPAGMAIMFAGLALLGVPLRRALGMPAPELGAPGYNGTLNLR